MLIFLRADLYPLSTGTPVDEEVDVPQETREAAEIEPVAGPDKIEPTEMYIYIVVAVVVIVLIFTMVSRFFRDLRPPSV